MTFLLQLLNEMSCSNFLPKNKSNQRDKAVWCRKMSIDQDHRYIQSNGESLEAWWPQAFLKM